MKDNRKKTIVRLLASIMIITFTGCNQPGEMAAEITGVAVTENREYTGRGNQNEVLCRVKINVREHESISLKNMVLVKSASTQFGDVKSIKIFSTDSLHATDAKSLASATMIGRGSLSKKRNKIRLSGDLHEGINYLLVTADIADEATEGNRIGIGLASIDFANNKRYIHLMEPSGGREILLARKVIFAPGDYNSRFYRIPAIITADDGTLITATDKRKESLWDLPQNIDVVIRRSTDNGKTWSEPVTIAEGLGYAKGYGDPLLTRLQNGKILCVFAGMNGLWQSTPDSLIRTYISESSDRGITWSAPRDLTAQLYGVDCPDPVRKKWLASFCASGQAIQTSKGRVMVVAAVRESSEWSLNNYLFYSDDEGSTWSVSQKAMEGGDEAKIVELTDGSILMSIRNKNKGNRYYTRSTDDGVTWSPVQQWSELKEPACNGDMIRYSTEQEEKGKNILLHSIPYDEKERVNVSVFVSYDEGKTWPVGKTICAGPSAYSSLTVLKDKTIGAYIEVGDNNGMNMVYLNFSLDWLTRHNGAGD